VTEQWDFRYVVPNILTSHPKCPGRIANNVRLDQRWRAEVEPVLEAAVEAGS